MKPTEAPATKREPRVERSLIVARMKQHDASDVARIFAESDAGDLPHMLKVTGRWLFRFHDLYFHLVEAEPGLADRIAQVRSHPLYTDVNDKLAQYISAYDPDTWRSPRDAMAQSFYTWRPTP